MSSIVAAIALLTPGCVARAPSEAKTTAGLTSRVARVCVDSRSPKKSRPTDWVVGPSRARMIHPANARSKPLAIGRIRGGLILDPFLAGLIAHSPPTDRATVLISFREKVMIPVFPSVDESEPSTSKTNTLRLREAQALIRSIRAQRDSLYRAEEADLAAAPGAKLVQKFWLAPVYAVEMPLGSVKLLAKRSTTIRVIEPAVGADPPPSCPDPSTFVNDNAFTGGDLDDPIVAQRLIASDLYRDLEVTHGTLSLLDTGVWKQHALLSTARLGLMGDCVHGNLDCLDDPTRPGFDPSDQCRDTRGHGTASAAILVGTSSLGDRWRGGLDLTLDSYQVFARGGCAACNLCLSRFAAARAFEAAVSNLNRVIVANIVAMPEEYGSLCLMADAAFHTGAIVVAANGNSGSNGVASPAAAPLVLGIGSRDLGALDQTEAGQSLGPAEGDRIKPDLQAPTGCETARYRVDCPANTRILTTLVGTSGATPYAGVAAAILRDWMKVANPELEPGHVYAAMILSGTKSGEGIGNQEGAGLIQLPSACCLWFGVEEVHPVSVTEIPIDLTGTGAVELDAAIWWPQNQQVGEADDEILQHNDIDLALVDGTGTRRGESAMIWSVFERASALVGPTPGTWKLQLIGQHFYPRTRDEELQEADSVNPTRIQRVYWAAAASRAPRGLTP
jgi:hypothetical protein